MIKEPFVIGIAGAVGAGKTWFAEKLKNALPVPACIFTLDVYSKDESFVNGLEYHYDNPLAIDYDKAYSDFVKLRQGEIVKLPIYDYVTHSVVSEITYCSPSVIIVEGLYAFYDKRFLNAMDFKIWIEADEDVRLERRIRRDSDERGELLEDSLNRHYNDSKPAYENYYKCGYLLADSIYFNSFSNNIPKIIDILIKAI